MIERKIGEMFNYNGRTVKVVRSLSCLGCMFDTERIYCARNRDITGVCGDELRSDGKSVIFIEIKCEPIDVNKECDL